LGDAVLSRSGSGITHIFFGLLFVQCNKQSAINQILNTTFVSTEEILYAKLSKTMV
jgi:hypothetical protein